MTQTRLSPYRLLSLSEEQKLTCQMDTHATKTWYSDIIFNLCQPVQAKLNVKLWRRKIQIVLKLLRNFQHYVIESLKKPSTKLVTY